MEPKYAMTDLLARSDLSPHEVFVSVMRIKDQLEERTKYHPGNCECTGCAWLCPVSSSEPWHGTMNGYGYHKCRCVRCRKANRQYTNSRR